MNEQGFNGKFSVDQTETLLRPINPARVFTTQGQSYVPYFEVLAHLNRVFGFGNFAIEVVDIDLIFETPVEASKFGTVKYGPASSKRDVEVADNPHLWRYDVCYRATVRLVVFDEKHNVVTTYENVSCGDSQNSVRHDAHDLALKSAVSTATKRCAIALGDQFGLALYNKGKTGAIVMGTKVLPQGYGETEKKPDPSEGVAQVESDGIDEIERVEPSPGQVEQSEAEATQAAEAEARLAHSLGAKPVEGKPDFQEGHPQDGEVPQR